jgi:hypothetical protein
MYEPWSVVAEYPYPGEPFGLVFNDDSTFTEAEYIARQLLSTFRLTGLYLPTSSQHNLEGNYLFTFTVSPETIPRLGTIWAYGVDDAELRLTVLASDGTLFMPTSG